MEGRFSETDRKSAEIMKIHTDNYLITAVPFYNYSNENEFKETLEKTLME
jgi:type III restriction enzyme